jgi:hypothetical protein
LDAAAVARTSIGLHFPDRCHASHLRHFAFELARKQFLCQAE